MVKTRSQTVPANRKADKAGILQQNDQGVKGINLAVWSDDLAPWVGNPLLVELKVGPSKATVLSAAASGIAQALAGSGMLWGLLVYSGPAIDPESIQAPANVLPLQAEKFLSDLRDVGFGDLVRRLRNQRVHGGH